MVPLLPELAARMPWRRGFILIPQRSAIAQRPAWVKGESCGPQVHQRSRGYFSTAGGMEVADFAEGSGTRMVPLLPELRRADALEERDHLDPSTLRDHPASRVGEGLRVKGEGVKAAGRGCAENAGAYERPRSRAVWRRGGGTWNAIGAKHAQPTAGMRVLENRPDATGMQTSFQRVVALHPQVVPSRHCKTKNSRRRRSRHETCNPQPATRNLLLGTCYLEPATWNLLLGTCYLEPATWNQQPENSNLQPATCNLQPATCNLQPATWNLQPATRNPELETLNL